MYLNGDFNLYNIIFNPINNIFVDARFIGNHSKLKKLVAVSMKVIAGISLVTVAASFFLTKPLVSVFARPDNPVYDLAVTGNRICTTE